jgi:hypothetical protein
MGNPIIPANFITSQASTIFNCQIWAFPQYPAFSTGGLWKPKTRLPETSFYPQIFVETAVFLNVEPSSCVGYNMFSTVC